MSITRTKLEQLHDDRYRRVTLAGSGRRTPLGRWLTEDGVVGGRWPMRLCLAWVVVFAVAIAVEPAPASSDASEPLWATVLFFGLFSALAVTVGGLARRRRLGLVASAAAGGLALVATVMCPVSDHHAGVGAWWFIQMTGFTGLVAASVAGLRRARTSTTTTTA